MKKHVFCLVVYMFTSITVSAVTDRSSSSEERLEKPIQFLSNSYDAIKDKIDSLPLTHTLEKLNSEYKKGLDIPIDSDDRRYLIPMLLGISGNKHAVGFSIESKNVFHKQEDLSFFIGGGRDGFDTHGELSLGKHSFYMGYSHINFEQHFYRRGWMSSPEIFTAADDKHKYQSSLLGHIHGRQDNATFSYQYRFSDVWSISLTPQYEYYRYKNNALDSGNHSHISIGLQYADHIKPTMDMDYLVFMRHLDKVTMLDDLPRIQRKKLAQVSYTAGGHWSGSNYTIQKLALAGSYQWEFKHHHLLALFAKAQKAFEAPFSNQIESSDLLFGMGVYDREQRGKIGVSAGISFTYFLLRNDSGILSLTPFYEQAYISTQNNSYQPHSGVGGSVTFRLWKIPLPINFSFTHNLNDGSHHLACKVGGKF